MKNHISPCLWFNGNAKEAAEFYCSVFENTVITDDNPMVVMIESSGQEFMLLNGGPQFTFNPSISFFVVCETREEVDNAWNLLSEGGFELMPIDKYEWSERYGWVQDKFGVNWQLSFGKLDEVGQKFTPTLMFTGKRNGEAEQAIQFYTSVFKESLIVGILRYPGGMNEVEGNVQHAQFSLGGHVFMAMDSSLEPHFDFSEAISFIVDCETQEEIDYYWDKLSAVPEAEQCGWLKDKFGVSWQIVPTVLRKLLQDPTRSDRVVDAFMQMKKFDIEKLINA
jgi:predicted 3-demethylubiquinone-9 3-methyltransferase (glyoxalase superfamily)